MSSGTSLLDIEMHHIVIAIEMCMHVQSLLDMKMCMRQLFATQAEMGACLANAM